MRWLEGCFRLVEGKLRVAFGTLPSLIVDDGDARHRRPRMITTVDGDDVFLGLGGSLLCMYPCAGLTPMHLASEYIHPYKDA